MAEIIPLWHYAGKKACIVSRICLEIAGGENPASGIHF